MPARVEPGDQGSGPVTRAQGKESLAAAQHAVPSRRRARGSSGRAVLPVLGGVGGAITLLTRRHAARRRAVADRKHLGCHGPGTYLSGWSRTPGHHPDRGTGDPLPVPTDGYDHTHTCRQPYPPHDHTVGPLGCPVRCDLPSRTCIGHTHQGDGNGRTFWTKADWLHLQRKQTTCQCSGLLWRPASVELR